MWLVYLGMLYREVTMWLDYLGMLYRDSYNVACLSGHVI